MELVADQTIAASGRPDDRTERQYRLALRHSRWVRRMKVALPAAAGVLILGFFLVSWVATRIPAGITVATTSIEDGKLVMYRPILTGSSSRERDYSLRAARAIQDLTRPSVIELDQIEAQLPMSDRVSAVLTAKSALFNRTADELRFTSPFEVRTDDGMTARLQGATVDIKAGRLVTGQPVTVDMSQGRISANTMQLSDRGKTVIFEKNVRMTIDPKAVRSASGTPSEQ